MAKRKFLGVLDRPAAGDTNVCCGYQRSGKNLRKY